MRRLALVFGLFTVLACSKEDVAKAPTSKPADSPSAEPKPKSEQAKAAEPTTDEPPARAPQDGFFMAEGAPDPRACSVASDCLGDTIPDLDNPCCQNPTSLEPYARTYRSWLGSWRGKHCAEQTCPPPPNPARPPACAFELACTEGVCVDSCP